MRVVPLLLLIALAVPFAPFAASLSLPHILPVSQTVPCTDPRGCPDMRADVNTMRPSLATRVFSQNDCNVQEGSTVAGTRQVLRFTATWPNLGAGALIVGDPSQHPEWFYFSPCHGHYHFKTYGEYRVWTPENFAAWDAYRNSHPDVSADDALNNTGLTFTRTHKGGFCVIDIRNEGALLPGLFFDCTHQGVSPGWADEYSTGLDGQYVDVTGLPHGHYILEEEANAHRLFDESNYNNNRAFVPVDI